MDHKEQDKCKEVAHFNASFELHLQKRDVGIAPLQGRRPDVGVPLISLHVGQVDWHFRTCKYSGNMNVKLCRSKRGGKHGKATGAEHVAVASCMYSD